MSNTGTPRLKTGSQKSAKRHGAAEVGVGGQVDHAFAEAALERRGDAGMRADLKDAQRVYDAGHERSWEQKYKFHSAQHMKGNYRVYARARHDPFNKDPSWGQSVIGKVYTACEQQGKRPDDLFKNVDLTGDGNLNRPEMKRILCGVLPKMSDLELATIFDVIDKDGSGEVNVREFCDAIKAGRNVQVTEASVNRWRNPVHRMKRIPPATIEGWDHLEGPTQHSRMDLLCESQTNDVISRLSSTLANNPRSLTNANTVPKYHYFNGGADATRFRRREWMAENPGGFPQTGPAAGGAAQAPRQSARGSQSARGPPSVHGTPRIAIPDPGLEPRPGFLCDPQSRSALVTQGLAIATPRQVAGAAA